MIDAISDEEETSAQDVSFWKAGRRRKVAKLRKRGLISQRASARQFPRETEEMEKGTARVGKGFPSIGT